LIISRIGVCIIRSEYIPKGEWGEKSLGESLGDLAVLKFAEKNIAGTTLRNHDDDD
jgi:hypothetical protein